MFSKQETTDHNGQSRPSDENKDFSHLLLLPEEVQLEILTKLRLGELLTVRETCSGLARMANIAMEDMCKPRFVIEYLSKANGIDGHQFIAEYQHTIYYKILKQKVMQNQPMTNEEIICYTLARDNKVLRQGLKNAMNSMQLDKQTKQHLQLIIETSSTIHKLEGRIKFSNGLIRMFMKHHPKTFVNLLAGAPLFPFDLRNLNLSHVSLGYTEFNHPYGQQTNMAGINLSHANLSYARLDGCLLKGADLRGVNLRKAKLNGAVLTNTLLDGTNLAEADLSMSLLINVDLRNVNLTKVDLEWTYLENVRLAPETCLENPQAMQAFLRQFEENFAQHSPGSLTNLRLALLDDLAKLIDSTNLPTQSKIELLEEILALYNPHTMTSSVIALKNPCADLYRKITTDHGEKEEKEEEYPLKKEFLGYVNTILDAIEQLPLETGEGVISKTTINSIINSHIKQINACLAKDPNLINGLAVCRAFGIDEFTWHLLVYGTPGYTYRPRQSANVVNYPKLKYAGDIYEGELFDRNLIQAFALQEKHSKKYAGDIFDGELFNLKLLQKISPSELDSKLYGEEDFVIVGKNREETTVKLGDLLIHFSPGGKGSVFAKIEVIDFQNQQLKPALNLDLKRLSNLKFEMLMPFNPFANYGAATAPSNQTMRRSDLDMVKAGFSLKKKIIERIFATQKGPNYSLSETQEIAVSGEKEMGSNDHFSFHRAEQARKETPPGEDVTAASVGNNRYALHGKPVNQPQTVQSRGDKKIDRSPVKLPRDAEGSCLVC